MMIVTKMMMNFFYSFLIEFMSFFDKNDYRDLQRSSVDFSLTFFKQQIIK
ncbi:hypothetical protein GKODMF_02745 [Candidatus Electrothrix gigas]